MKRYVVPFLLMAILVAGTALTCKNIVQPQNDYPLAAGNTEFFAFNPAASDYPIRPAVHGCVYFYGDPQNGAIVTLIHESGDTWQYTTQTNQDGVVGYYWFWCPRAGSYGVRAQFQGSHSQRRSIYVEQHSQELFTIDLCIGYRDPSPDDQ